jgi:tetratricopeptide (TPR) repeat protein
MEAREVIESLEQFRHQAETSTTEITKAARVADEMVLTMRETRGRVVVTEEQKRELENAANAVVEGSSSSQLTSSEYRVLLGNALSTKQWRRARDLAITMRTTQTKPSVKALAYLYEAEALNRMGSREEEIATLRSLIHEYGHRQAGTKSYIDRGHSALASALVATGRIKEGIAEYRNVLARYEGVARESLDHTYVFASINLGAALSEAGDTAAAINQYDKTIEALRNLPIYEEDRAAAFTNKCFRLYLSKLYKDALEVAGQCIAEYANGSISVQRHVNACRLVVDIINSSHIGSPELDKLVHDLETVEYHQMDAVVDHARAILDKLGP